MSKENAKRFFELIGENQELKSKYVEVVGKYLGQTLSEAEMDKIYLEILPLAREAGSEFTLAELKALQAPQEGKLSEEELDQVVAGQAWGVYKIVIVCEKLFDDNQLTKYLRSYPNDCPHFKSVNYNFRACTYCQNLSARTWQSS